MDEASSATNEAFDEALSAISSPGLAVAICDRRGALWHSIRGTCDIEKGGLVALSTRFSLCSVTKTFTGMAILNLRDAGLLSLDDPLTRFLPEAASFRYPTKDCPPIRIRHILTHTSGLPRGVRELRSDLAHDPNEEELLNGISSLEIERAPGTTGRYSNLGFALLGIVIRRASGREYADFLMSRIIEPLGLSATSFQPTEPLAAPHRAREGHGLRPASCPLDNSYQPVSGLYSSASDLVRYVGVHLNAWPPRDEPEGTPTLCRATLRESHRPGGFHRVGRNSRGLGWSIDRDGVVGDVVHHSGGSPYGYSSFVGFEPDVGVGIVGLANSDIDLEKPLLALLGLYAVEQGLVKDRRR